MARLFISYKHEDEAYAFALRQWLIDDQSWHSDDIFIDRDKLRAGQVWADRIFSEAERAEVVLFLASNAALHPKSFCYKELQRARGITLAVTIKGLSPDDDRLASALPHGATARQIAALDGQPTDAFAYVSPIDGTHGAIGLNRRQVESIGEMLRDLGIAPNSFNWKPTEQGPYPGLAALQEGDEALFFGRDIEIRDCLRLLEDMRTSISDRALLIQAPSGAGKSSFLRAGLWRRLRRHAGFTPLAIVRTRQGVLFHEQWGLVAGLAYHAANKLQLSRHQIEEHVRTDLAGLLRAISDEDAARGGGRRTLLLAIDQAEEIASLNGEEAAELSSLFQALSSARDLDIRLLLTVRDDSIEPTLEGLERIGIQQPAVRTFRLHRLPHARYAEVIRGPAATANRSGYPLHLDDALVVALSSAAAESLGRIADALPILALALQRLVRNHRTPTGKIDLPPDQAMSFLTAAIAAAAGDAMRSSMATEADLKSLVVPKLVAWDPRAGEGGAAKRLVATRADLFDGHRQRLEGLAEALVDQRLLTKNVDKGDIAYEVAHEALLRAKPLGDFIVSLRAKFLRADIVQMEAAEWVESRSDDERLARRGQRLREAEELLVDRDFGEALAKKELSIAGYLEACRRKDQEENAQREQFQKAQLASAAQVVDLVERETPKREIAGLQGRIFISHASRNADKAEMLGRTLKAQGFEVLLDFHDIGLGEAWSDRLDELIQSADSVVVLLSPAYVESDYCHYEWQRALQGGKRLLPVVVEHLGGAQPAMELARLNWISMLSPEEEKVGVFALTKALGTDLPWLRERRRLTEIAIRWRELNRPELLLRGSELLDAERWADRAPRSEDIPSEIISFINASIDDVARFNAQARKLGQRTRWAMLFLSTTALGALLVSIALAWSLMQNG